MMKKLLPFQLPGFEDLEISTQLIIAEAKKRDIEVIILDRSAHFLQLKKVPHIEFVKEATKTRLDSYMSYLIMENKQVTKHILHEAEISVPTGKIYFNPVTAKRDFQNWQNRKFVVKPTNTNFGIGISAIDNPDPNEYQSAIDLAFGHDRSILIEEFISGKEFRFLVIGDETFAVLHRVPANVIGDGIHTVSQLIQRKNQDPMRGQGYKTPLEYLQASPVEAAELASQGLNFDSIPASNQQIFLRQNSNISTGGDSIDYTSEVPDSYKKIAIKAAQAIPATICGIDMIIADYHQAPANSNHAIIEMNFNPALQIHAFPYQGQSRNAAPRILDLLGF